MKFSLIEKIHLVKTLTYRLISTTVGSMMLWLFTGSVGLGTIYWIVELIYKPIQYYLHENIWSKIVKFPGLQPKKEILVENEISIQNRPEEPEQKKLGEKKVLNYTSSR